MAKFLKPYFEAGPLSHLSVTRGDQATPTNTERRDAFHQHMPRALHNPYPWPYLQPKPQMESVADLAKMTFQVVQGGRR